MLLMKILKPFDLTEVLLISLAKSGIAFSFDTFVHNCILVLIVFDDKGAFAMGFVTFFC
jgi:hypothetical protein